MSLVPGDSRIHDSSHLRGTTKSRIPSKVPTRQKQQPLRPKLHGETQVSLRPKSANRVKDDGPSRQSNTRTMQERALARRKSGNYNKDQADQDSVQICEDLELVTSGVFPNLYSSKNKEGIPEDNKQIEVIWQKYTTDFELMKKDLDSRQRAIVELYASMRNTHQKLSEMGQAVTLPPSDELTVMNVAKLSPDQLLELCTVNSVQGANSKSSREHQEFAKTPLTICISKLYDLPTKIIATCEQTITKRREIIDWVTDLTREKGISRHCLDNRMQEYKAENEMLTSSLEQAKGGFQKSLEEIIEFIRKTMNEAKACQLRTEEQLCMMAELDSENADLRKQLHNTDNFKLQRTKIEELEKQLKEEKRTKTIMRDHLERAAGQIKIRDERALQLETALEQAKSHSTDLEQLVQKLQKQGQQLQANFDKELSNLTLSVKENMQHLEEIADARAKLQTEKEDLEKRLEDLSQYYNESLKSVKHDMNVNIAKLIETEKKFDVQVEEKKKVLEKLEAMCAQTVECEMRNKNLEIVLREKETQLGKALKYEKEWQTTKEELNLTIRDLKDCKSQLLEQSKTIKQLEDDLENSRRLEEELKTSLVTKDKNIGDLEKKRTQLEEQLQDRENKISSYEIQLSSLKSHITQLQDDFGEFDNLEELHDMINQQRANLLETTRQNGELAQALQKKDEELDRHLERLAEQEHIMKQKDGCIKLLSDKEEEQTKIIKLLRTNLEMRTQADVDLSQQISEKNSEIEALIANVETRKQQISQLETIILTLEEQTSKSIMERRKKDQERINFLEKQIAEYEAFHLNNKHDLPDKNLDSIIDILEKELGTSVEPRVTTRSHEYVAIPKKKFTGDQRREYFECHKGKNQTAYQTEQESIPTKIVLDNIVNKTYTTNPDLFKVDNLGRKKAILNIETHKWVTGPHPGPETYSNTPPVKENLYGPLRGGLFNTNHPFLTRNLPLFNIDQFREDKRNKMFKLACHKL
ncbi:unnamed protein product [Arctia plantaginis]|uniref:Uncharacterized protein n=1 Tax=Arctia plantaginis TaxID=874455 RepID=A0A8S1BE77_ARCPL|nr:unnamed protein product [Arctia plantaginis]CAB3256628.1 unnamed protein product [Arctia plantaginis]